MSYAVIGGTFDGLHKGHEAFISKAFETGDKVLVCITSDAMVKGKPHHEMIDSFARRKSKVSAFLKARGWLGRAEIVSIDDPFTAGLRPGLTDIIVTQETRKNAERLNAMRKGRGLPKLAIAIVEWVRSDDGKPISDARIRKGEIDKNGRML